MLAQADVAVVEFPAVDNHQVADFGVMSIDAVDTDVADFSVHNQLTVIWHHRRRCDDLPAQGVADGLHVGKVDEIGLYLGVVFAARFIVGPNQVRANTANLIENQVSAGQRNRDNENDRGVSNDQAQASEKRPQPVGVQRL